MSSPVRADVKTDGGLELRSWAMAGVLLLLWAVLAVLPATRETFLNPHNLVNLTVQIAPIAVIAVGMTLVIIIRGIDLSVGAGVALTGVVAALLQIDHGMPAWVAIAAALAAGAALGLWQGFWVARFGIPAFVVTLAGFKAYRGLALEISDARGLAPMGEDFAVVAESLPAGISIALIAVGVAVGLLILQREAARRRKLALPPLPRIAAVGRVVATLALGAGLLAIYSGGMPVPVLLAGLAVIAGVFLTKKTRFGRHVYAIGGNPEAAEMSGIDVRRTTVWVYVFIGVLTALAGIIMCARVNGVTPGNTGMLLELDVITAVVIGGTSLSGGRGSVVGSLIGALVFGTLANGMNLLGIETSWQWIFTGMLLLAAVLIDVLSKGNRR